MKKYLWMPSAAVVIGALGVNLETFREDGTAGQTQVGDICFFCKKIHF